MAPQNSTLIHENVDATSEFSRYSPISPLEKEGRDVFGEKSISNHSINIKEGEEMPFWIGAELRYISGITNATTCNDIIQALINDELYNCTPSTRKDVAGSHDFHDYVITERWRDIEQALPGSTYILPIWKAWGEAKNEVKFKLKINKNKAWEEELTKAQETKKHKKDNVGLIRKLIHKIVKQGELIHSQLFKLRPAESSLSLKRRDVRRSRKQKSKVPDTSRYKDDVEADEDELLLIISPSGKDSNKFEYKTITTNDKNLESYILNKRHSICQNAIPETPHRKKIYENPMEHLRFHEMNYEHLRNPPNKRNSMPNYFNNEDDNISSLRNEIFVETLEIRKLLEQEEFYVKHLSRTCNKYKAENELYKMKLGLDICVEHVQDNLTKYADEIVQTEIKLYKIKIQIKRKLAIMDNLKRMLSYEVEATKTVYTLPPRRNNTNLRESFVDNIHEFCDNNASIIV